MKSLFFILTGLLFCFQLTSQVSFTITSSICKNDTSYLIANTGSVTNCTYTWVCTPVGSNLASPNNSATSLSFTSAGTYTVILAVTSGTFNTSVQNSVTVLTLPTITLAQNSLTTCIANNFPLFSKPVHLTATGGQTYTWNPPFTSQTGNPNGPANDVRPPSNACFSVTGEDATGCKAMASICVTVIPRFTINISPSNTLICQNGFSGQGVYAELIANNTSSPAYGLPATHSYSWTGGNILTPPFSATIDVAPFTTSTYTAEIRDSINCVSQPAMVTVSVQNCTGTLQNTLEYDLLVYPNPVCDNLYIKSNAFKSYDLVMINLLGKIIYYRKNILEIHEIDFRLLPAGLYYLKVINSDGEKSFKLMKN